MAFQEDSKGVYKDGVKIEEGSKDYADYLQFKQLGIAFDPPQSSQPSIGVDSVISELKDVESKVQTLLK